MKQSSLALYGAFGAILPEVVLLYSKRWAMPLLVFSVWQYILLTVVYMASAGVVSAIFPYRGEGNAFKALTVGIALPTVVSSAAAS